MSSNKILGILLLLIYVCVCTAILNDAFIKPYNLQNLLRSSSMFAIIGIGAVLVIVTGGIDLSTGSLIGLVGCTMTMTLKDCSQHPPADNGSWLAQMVGVELLVVAALWVIWELIFLKANPTRKHVKTKIGLIAAGIACLVVSQAIGGMEFGPWLTMAVAVAIALILSIHLGLLHGLLITKLKLQPFVVTLCGLMCYRGLSRYLTGDKTQGLGTDYNDSLRLMAIGKPCTATSVMLAFSIVILLYGLWRVLISKKAKTDSAVRVQGLTILVVGIVLAVVSSSRYWDGWQTNYGDTIANVAGMDVRFFSVEVSETAKDRPANLMKYSIWPALACFVGLFVLSFRRLVGRQPNQENAVSAKAIANWTLPLLLCGGSIAGLVATQNWIGDEVISFSEMSSFWASNVKEGADDQYIFQVNVIFWKMFAVFCCMAALMLGVLWMGKSWVQNSGNLAKSLWTMTAFFSVLWLLGHTAIHETIVQTPFFFLLFIGVAAALFLNTTVYGRYFFALGNNEEATRFSGINTDNVTILAYVLCALCGGIGAVLFTLDSNNVEPSGHGSFYELYAIAAAVLGGCSLRGGEGSILGVIIGASIMRVLYNAPDMIGIASQLEMFTIGFVLLIGIIVDETARRMAAKRDRATGVG